MSEEEEVDGFYFMGLHFPIYKDLLIRTTMIVWVLMLLVLLLSMWFLQYEMTNADLPCGSVAGVLLAYLYTLVVRD